MRNYNPFFAISGFIVTLLSVAAIQPAAGAEPPFNKLGVLSNVEPLVKIAVEAGNYERIDTVVSVELDEICRELALDSVHLIETLPSGSEAVAAQIEAGNPPRLWWILSGTTPAKCNRYYVLVRGCGVEAADVKVIKNDSFLQLQAGDTNVLRYNHAKATVN